jgi:hypothetical protein
MTIFDLLFLMAFLSAVIAVVIAIVAAVRGDRAHSLAILRKLAFSVGAYLGMVYTATAVSKQVVLGIGDPECSDDWCIAVEGVKRTPKNTSAVYAVTLRIFSRARRVAQREMGAKDVYLVDSRWNRYDPVPAGHEVPLNILLHAGESVRTSRTFELPAGAGGLGLMVDRTQPLPVPVCLIIDECGAFHKGVMIRIGC